MTSLFWKNYKTLLKGIENVLNEYRDIPHSWISKISVLKIAIFIQIEL